MTFSFNARIQTKAHSGSRRIPFNPEAPKKSLAIRPPNSQWEYRRLRDSQTYCNNIPPHAKTKLIRRLLSPSYLLLATCLDTRAPVEDIIISRVRNRETPAGKTMPDLISIMVASRTGVTGKLYKAFQDAGLPLKTPFCYQDDMRFRVGITLALNEDLDIIDKMLETIDQIVELPADFKTTYKELIQSEFNPTSGYLGKLEKDVDYHSAYLNDLNSTLFFAAHHAVFTEDDRVIQTALPEIHQLILNHDEERLSALLEKSPTEALRKDPWGIDAYYLARMLGTVKQMELILAAWERCPLLTRPEGLTLHNMKRLVKENIGNARAPSPSQYSKALAHYQKIQRNPIPIRSAFHQACIDGKTEVVKAAILQDKSRLNEKDPRGFTPALLAAANGHATLLKWLLDNGASADRSSFNNGMTEHHYRLVDNASTPEVVEVVLHYGIDPEDYLDRFLLAINDNNLQMARRLMSYIHAYPDISGLTFINYAIRLSDKQGTAMLSTLLLAHQDYVQEGPYDYDITPETAAVLMRHNEIRKRRNEAKSSIVRISKEETHSDTLISILQSNELVIDSLIKPLSKVTADEQQQMEALAFDTFSLIENDTIANRREAIKTELTEVENRPTFATLFKDQHKVVAFFIFEIFHLENHSVFHGKIAASLNDPRYASQGFVTFAFRNMIALQQAFPERRTYTYLEAIAPGYGFCAAVPEETQYFPKYVHLKKITEEMARLTHADMRGNIIKTKLQVTNRSVKSDSLRLNFFRLLTNDSARQAMPVCYELTASVKQAYLTQVAPNGVTATNLSLCKHYLQKHAPLPLMNNAPKAKL